MTNDHSANDNSQLSSEIDALLLSRLKGPMLEFVRTQTHALHTKLAEAQGKLHRTQQELIETKQKLLERERKYRELRNKSLAYRQQVQEWYDVVASTPLSPRPQYNMHHRKSVATASTDPEDNDNDNAVVQVHGNKEDACLSNASTVVVENTTTTTTTSSRASKKRRTHHHHTHTHIHTTVEEQDDNDDDDDDDDIVALVKQEDDSDDNNNNNNTMSMIIPAAAAVTAAPSSSSVVSSSISRSRINRATKSLAALKARCNIDATEEEDHTNNKEYKYEEVVRKKEDRRQLKGYDCADCRAFLDAICKDKNGKEHGMFNRSEFVQECSRHRARHIPEDTPPGFWELSFADSVAARGHDDQE